MSTALLKSHKMRHLSVLMAISLLTISCQTNTMEPFDKRVASIVDESDITWSNIVVIPGEGCGGCISNATYFVMENIEKMEDTAIIFTGVLDKKLLRQQVGAKLLAKANVFVDTDNLLMNKEVVSVYPYILSVNNFAVNDKLEFEESQLLIN